MFAGKYLQSLTLVLLLLPVLANAESTRRVYPGYVVSRHVEERGLSADDNVPTHELMAAGLQAKELGSGSQLLMPSQLADVASDEAQSSEYDESKTVADCAVILALGYTSCEPNWELRASEITPNDPKFSSLWGMRKIEASRAWDKGTGSRDVVVAVIDTGIDYTHPDLAANVWTNPGEIAGNGIDDDRNGYIDDVHGMSAVNNSGNPMDDNSHGTHVSGTIGGVGNNGTGVSGVNWQVKIMGLRFLNAQGSGSLAGAIQAINYMVKMKTQYGINVRVSNNSWGGGGYSQNLADAISRANQAGIIFVAAAGNETNDNDALPSYPASYEMDNVISVAATDENDNVAYFSNYGAQSVDIAAPGVTILSTVPGNGYASYSGTSMATPHVTGALALLLSLEPGLSVSAAILRLYDSGDAVATLQGLVRSGRRLNVANLVYNQTNPLPVPTAVPQCSYAMQEIDYAPSHEADAAPIVVQADEFGFQSVALPFSFPFYGQNISAITLSPNGVVYVQGAPTTFDYQNSSQAPRNSIAALQTDLIAPSDPFGVRVALASDHVTIAWRAYPYSRAGSVVSIETRLYSSGEIQNFVGFSDSTAEGLVQQSATVGVNGLAGQSAATYAYNNSRIRNQMAVRFTPVCGSNPVDNAFVSNIRLRGNDREVNPGDRLAVRFQGSGTGSKDFKVAFNGLQCSNSFQASMSDGKASMRALLPRVNELRSLSVTADGISGDLRIKSRSKSKGRTRRISAREVTKICNSFERSLR